MTRREHGHALPERQARDVRDLAKAVSVLKEERLAVYLDQLTAIGRGRWHAISIAGRGRSRRRSERGAGILRKLDLVGLEWRARTGRATVVGARDAAEHAGEEQGSEYGAR